MSTIKLNYEQLAAVYEAFQQFVRFESPGVLGHDPPSLTIHNQLTSEPIVTFEFDPYLPPSRAE